MAHTASLSQLQTPKWALLNGRLTPYDDIRIHISAEALTRALSVFEGLKGYWDASGDVFSVRTPRRHYDRLCRSAALFHIPIDFTYDEFLDGLGTLAAELLVSDRDLWFRTTLYVTQGHWGEGTQADLVVTAFTQQKNDPEPMRDFSTISGPVIRADRQAGASSRLLRRNAQTTTSAARMVSGQPIAILATPSQPVASLM